MARGPLVTTSPEEQERARHALKLILQVDQLDKYVLADRLGVSRSSVHSWLNGHRKVPDRVVERVAWLAPDEN